MIPRNKETMWCNPIWQALQRSSLLLVLAITSTACSTPPQGREGDSLHTADSITFRVEMVATGLEVPWSIVFDPDGRILITERPGRVRLVINDTLRAEPMLTLPDVLVDGETGLMGLTLHPDYRTNRFVYLAYTYGTNEPLVRVARYREVENRLVEPITIIENIPAASNHAGCRIRFGPDGMLYITTGDATDGDLAQDSGSLAGKILRLRDDGTIPPDNPFAGRAGVRGEIWSLGHRNPQGIDWHPVSGIMMESEYGPSGFDGGFGGDEINIIRKGANYGWPIVHHTNNRPGLVPPLLEYTPAVAPGSGSFHNVASVEALYGNFLVGCLRGRCIIRVVMDGERVVRQEKIVNNTFGRIRAVVSAPDGSIYFSTSNRDGRGTPSQGDDRIIRLVPINQ